MSEKNNHIESSDFKEYFSDKMNADKKTSFENNLEVDSFEKEALEGFQILEDDAAALAAIYDIESEIEKRTNVSFNNSKEISFWKPLAIAASLFFIIGSGFVISKLFKNENTNLADNSLNQKIEHESTAEDTFKEKKRIPEAVEDITEGNRIEEESSFDGSIESINAPKQAERTEAVVPVYEEEVIAKNTPTLSVTDDAGRYDETVEKVVPESPSEHIMQVEEEVVPINAAKTITSSDTEIRSGNDNSITNIEVIESIAFKEGKIAYQNKNFNDAINDFQSSINGGENIVESRYYIGMCYMNLNKNNKAIKSFNHVIATNSSLRNNSLWYKSQILLQQGNTNEASIILEELSTGKSSFKNKALEILKQLN